MRRLDGDAESRERRSVPALRRVLGEDFGIALPEEPVPDDVLEQVLKA